MAYNSRVQFSSTTGTTFSYAGVSLLNDRLVSQQSQLVVTVNGTALTYTAGVAAAGEYSLNKTTVIMTLGTALVSTDVLDIRRSTKKDALYVTFTNNAPLTDDDLKLALQQLLFIAQEASESQDVQRTFEASGQITGFRNQSYILTQKAAFPFDVTSLTTKCSGGSCTLKLQIDGVDVTGSSHTSSTSESSQTGMSANRVLTGQTLSIVISASSPAVDTFNVAYTLACQEL